MVFVMKNLIPLSFVASLAIVAGLTSTGAYADYEQQVDTAAKNQQRAAGQQFKAERAADRGDFHKAEKHSENMRLDEFKVNRNENRAARDAARGDL
jgi:hypothetical protein